MQIITPGIWLDGVEHELKKVKTCKMNKASHQDDDYHVDKIA